MGPNIAVHFLLCQRLRPSSRKAHSYFYHQLSICEICVAIWALFLHFFELLSPKISNKFPNGKFSSLHLLFNEVVASRASPANDIGFVF